MLSWFVKKSNHIMDQEVERFMRSRAMDRTIGVATAPLLNDRDIKRVEIIVLKYKSPAIEEDCVSRIIRYTKHPYKLNVFDNRGNGPNTSKIWNKLIRESTCDYVLFIDSDAFVQNTIGQINGERHDDGVCWVSEMMKAFTISPDIVWVGPVAGKSGVTTMQTMYPKDQDPITIEGHLSGYCFLTKKSIYEEVGYFDEDYCLYGQESDWIERILESNKYNGTRYKLAVAPRAHVTHGLDESGGSLAAKQAEKEGEIDIGIDSEYSYLMWNEKKMLRLRNHGVKHEFKL